MTGYIIEVQEDESGELFVELPDDLIDVLDWEEGDILDWKIKGDSVILSKLNDSSTVEPVEDEF